MCISHDPSSLSRERYLLSLVVSWELMCWPVVHWFTPCVFKQTQRWTCNIVEYGNIHFMSSNRTINAAQVTKNISCAKGKGEIHYTHSTIIRVRRTRHCWRGKDELISDVLLWTPTYGQAKAGRPARTYIQQLCEDTGCNPEDLPEAMNNREKWRERVRDIRAGGATWWWMMMTIIRWFKKFWLGLKETRRSYKVR